MMWPWRGAVSRMCLCVSMPLFLPCVCLSRVSVWGLDLRVYHGRWARARWKALVPSSASVIYIRVYVYTYFRIFIHTYV
jgi:hypothetical protein